MTSEFLRGLLLGYILGQIAIGLLAWKVGVLKKMVDYLEGSQP